MASSPLPVPGLTDLAAWATAEEVALAELLLAEDQAHLFAAWVPGANTEKKRAFFEQVRGRTAAAKRDRCLRLR